MVLETSYWRQSVTVWRMSPPRMASNSWCGTDRAGQGRHGPSPGRGQEPRPPATARPVTEHPSWPRVLRALEAGHINRAEAAKKLRVRKAALIEALASFPNGGPAQQAPHLAGATPDRRSQRKSFGNDPSHRTG